MRVLDDIRVLDLSGVVSGPFCTMQLGDMGADVIKLEESTKGDDSRSFGPPFVTGESAYFLSFNRNKRSLAIDLKHPDALPLVRRLVEQCDVFVENFSPGAVDRLGLGYSNVSSWNPHLIYCSISGFGTTGPVKNRRSYDLVVQGESGIMDLTGDPSGPPTKVGTCIADLVTGLYAAQAILLALRARERLGRGQKVEVAMIDAMASLLTYNAGMYFASGREPTRYGNAHPMIVPYGSFKTSDGWVNIAVANDNLWKKFCDACGFDRTVCDDPRFASARARVENRDILLPFVTDIIEQNTKIHWIRLFERAGVPCGEIRTTGEVCEDPALIARGMIRSIAHSKIGRLRTIDTPVRLYDTPAAPGVGAPVLGQHTASILQEILGLTPLEVQLLRESHVIMCARAESAH